MGQTVGLPKRPPKISQDQSLPSTLPPFLWRISGILFFTLVVSLIASGGTGFVATGTYSSTDTAFDKNNTDHSHVGLREVEWIEDREWFDAQTKKGCCPYAKTLYATRYSKIEYRCCTSRLEKGRIDPLRAVGGGDYLHLARKKPNVTVLIQGDSLAEQHFLGMICFAWSAHGLPVHLQRLSYRKNHMPGGAIWQANIEIEGEGGIASSITIQHLRWDKPAVAPDEVYNLLRSPDYFILGGWHHGGTDSGSIKRFLRDLAARKGAKKGQKIMIVDALPSHFPGGKYLPSGAYPNSTDACTQTSLKGAPNINGNLTSLVGKETNFTLLEVSTLYHHRGNAHIGFTPGGRKDRDCLHWCIAPGVLDALTKSTLAAILNIDST